MRQDDWTIKVYRQPDRVLQRRFGLPTLSGMTWCATARKQDANGSQRMINAEGRTREEALLKLSHRIGGAG